MLCAKSCSAKQVWKMMDNDGDESKKEFSDNAMEEEQAQGAYKAVAATKNDDDDRARVPKESRRERERERETGREGAKRRNKEAACQITQVVQLGQVCSPPKVPAATLPPEFPAP